ncbi:hypothetical protein evm_007730 [Chilo suppressalis]|nr:hypothetical protein evm_007730 [Chilo suppressalis]
MAVGRTKISLKFVGSDVLPVLCKGVILLYFMRSGKTPQSTQSLNMQARTGAGLPYGWNREITGLSHDAPRGPSVGAYDAAGTNDLTYLPKHGGARDRRFLATHPLTDHCESCLVYSTIAAECANYPRHRAPQVYHKAASIR